MTHRIALAVVAVAGLALAACGQKSGESDASAGSASAPAATPALPGKPPHPKPGKWRLTNTMEGVPGMGEMPPIEVCYTREMVESTDWAEGRQADAGVDCPVRDIRPTADGMVVHSVCNHEGMTMTSDVVVKGDMERAYTVSMTTTTDPAPPHTPNPMKMSVKAERIGDCDV